jgi:bifunctional UDP-N-acetylglucosamine pyrophosphorylase/glucosamine-1-phosphate N-acetyltransferase
MRDHLAGSRFSVPSATLRPVKALLLLAGKSTRFWPLAEKTLFPIAGKTILEHQLERLRRCGVHEVMLVTGAHNTEETRAMFPDAEIVEQEDASLGTRGGLLSALPACGGEEVLVVCGNDLVEDRAIADVLAAAKGKDGAILGKRMATYFPGGYLSIDGGRATGIVEKPGAGNEPSDLVNIEVHAHADASVLLRELERIDNVRDDGYEQALQTMFRTRDYAVVEYDGAWRAIKFPWHALDALPFLLGSLEPRIDPTAVIHPTAVVEGPVVIGPGARMFPHATVKGPCYVGARTVVGNGALVRNSSVGDDCVIGYNTEVQASILHSHVWTHSTYLGDSVVGRNVSFGAGCVTGNLRLDEGEVQSAHKENKMGTGRTKFGAVIGDDCRVGIHVSTNPGIKIGRGSLVAGHLLVDRDLDEGTYARFKDGAIAVTKNTARIPDPAEREKYLKKA